MSFAEIRNSPTVTGAHAWLDIYRNKRKVGTGTITPCEVIRRERYLY